MTYTNKLRQAEVEVCGQLIEKVDMDFALRVSKLATEYKESDWTCLRSSCLLHMLGQARLLARIIGMLKGVRPKLSGLSCAALTQDGRCFAAHFDELFSTWEDAIVDFDMPLATRA